MLLRLFLPDTELSRWEELSGELAAFLLCNLSQKLANPNLRNDERLQALELAAGFSQSKKTMRRASTPDLSAKIQRASRNPGAQELATQIRASLQAVCFAPPQLFIGNAHKWRNLFATSGIGGGASDDTRNKLFEELRELLIFSPGDLAQLRARRLPLISENPESIRLLGQLRRAVKVAEGATDLFFWEGTPFTFYHR